VLLSATATVMFVAFFVLYLSPFTAGAPTATAARAAGFVTTGSRRCSGPRASPGSW